MQTGSAGSSTPAGTPLKRPSVDDSDTGPQYRTTAGPHHDAPFSQSLGQRPLLGKVSRPDLHVNQDSLSESKWIPSVDVLCVRLCGRSMCPWETEETPQQWCYPAVLMREWGGGAGPAGGIGGGGGGAAFFNAGHVNQATVMVDQRTVHVVHHHHDHRIGNVNMVQGAQASTSVSL